MGYHELKSYTVNPGLMDKILTVYQKRIVVVPNIEHYILGYQDKDVMYYDGTRLIVKELTLFSMANKSLKGLTEWKQCVITSEEYQKDAIKHDYNGRFAYNQMKAILLKYYTLEEYESQLNAFTAEYDDKKKQVHYDYDFDDGAITLHENCYKYDINGAHNYALSLIFPKAKEKLIDMYNKRKTHPENKKFVNYYVGYLTQKSVGHRLTYNWIVQKTTELLMAAMNEVGGAIIYANTDGFMVEDPDKLLTVSKDLGGFKLEHAGRVWTYTDKNYKVFQYIDENGEYVTRGSALSLIRDMIDLPNGKVVHYDRVLRGHCYVADNIMKEVIL